MSEKKKPDNMALWNSMCETDPSITKQVEFGARKFTAIDAYSQFKRATAEWGACGQGWGWRRSFEIVDGFVVCELTLWYGGEREAQCHEVPAVGTSKIGVDAWKKAQTDAITKAFSFLGMNADIFLGRFEDNRYVDQMREKFADKNGKAEEPLPDGQPTEDGQLVEEIKAVMRDSGMVREHAQILTGGHSPSKMSIEGKRTALEILKKAGELLKDIAAGAKRQGIEGSSFDIFIEIEVGKQTLDELNIEELTKVRDALDRENREGNES